MGDNPAFAQAARELAIRLVDLGHTVVYGGSAIGLMGIVAQSALERGGTVIGVEPRFFIEAGVEQHELTELVVVETMSERKAKMIELGEAFIALPGGVGTLEEISEIASRIRLGLTQAPCILLNIDGYYDALAAMLDQMRASGFLRPHERDAILFPATVGEAISLL
jgi:uncharacterized protein (TIGR00730 family)